MSQFLFGANSVRASDITASNVQTEPRSATSMHLQWDNNYSGNTVILYQPFGTSDWLSDTANCYDNYTTGGRQCQITLHNLVSNYTYYYKFREGDITQEFSYSYFVVPTELRESNITISNTTGRSVTFTWQTDKVTKGKIIYYPADN
ncbi:MAG: hypothetical protein UV02_C0027G0001, partial [Candidatus Kuenenbacteria bacterium GW2011_GWA2_42_15]